MVENDTAVEQVEPLHLRAAFEPMPELETLMEAIAGPEEATIGTVGQQPQIEALRESMRAMHNDMRVMHDENRAFRAHFDMFMSTMMNVSGRLAAIERAVELRPQVQTHSVD